MATSCSRTSSNRRARTNTACVSIEIEINSQNQCVIPASEPIVSSPNSGPSGPPEPQGSVPLFYPGDVVDGRHRVVGFIAEGGMGMIYEVEDQQLGVHLALKAVKPIVARQASNLERFRREVRLASRVTHSNVCRIYGTGLHRDGNREIHYLTMELLEGESLTELLQRKDPIPSTEAFPLVYQMASGLAAAHEAGVVHRDFKSANIMLVDDETVQGQRVVITDFGLARSLISEQDTHQLTATGQLMGTPAYFAPELLEGKPLTTASDLYSLGVVVYELLSGRVPFEGRNPLMVALRRLNEDPTPIQSHVPDVDPLWIEVIGRCLQRLPEERFRSGKELLRMLEEHAGPEGVGVDGKIPTPTPPPGAVAPDRPEPSSPDPQTPRTARRWIAPLAAVLALALVFLLGSPKGGPPEEVAPYVPNRVAIALPEGTSGSQTYDVLFAMHQVVESLEGLRVVDPRAVLALPPEADIAKATAVDEVLVGRWMSGGDLELRRVRAGTRTVMWSKLFDIPGEDPRFLLQGIGVNLHSAFSDRAATRPFTAQGLDRQDLETVLDLWQRTVDPAEASAEAIGAWTELSTQLEDLAMRLPNVVEIPALAARRSMDLHAHASDDSMLELARHWVSRIGREDLRRLNLQVELDLLSGDHGNAALTLDQLEARLGEDTEVLRWRARLAEERGDPERAVELLTRAVDLRPSWYARLELADLEIQCQRFARAERILHGLANDVPGLDGVDSRLQALRSRPPAPQGSEATP